jgi:phosphoglycolate phosphatase
MTTYQAVVFDFDLTLADSLPGFYVCHDHAAHALGLPQPDRNAVGRLIGTPLPLALRSLYGLEDPDAVSEYIRLYQQHADAVMLDLTVMLPGAAEAVQALQGAGLRLAILSQKYRYRIEAVLQREGLLPLFDTILGGEDIPDFKPDPRGLLDAITRLMATPQTAVYAGDTIIDAETARRAGLPFIAVLGGFTERHEFDAYSPLAVIDAVSQLPALLLP